MGATSQKAYEIAERENDFGSDLGSDEDDEEGDLDP